MLSHGAVASKLCCQAPRQALDARRQLAYTCKSCVRKMASPTSSQQSSLEVSASAAAVSCETRLAAQLAAATLRVRGVGLDIVGISAVFYSLSVGKRKK